MIGRSLLRYGDANDEAWARFDPVAPLVNAADAV
jgi:hypothetical protein